MIQLPSQAEMRGEIPIKKGDDLAEAAMIVRKPLVQLGKCPTNCGSVRRIIKEARREVSPPEIQ